MRKVVSKAAKSLSVVGRAGKLFDCPRVLKSCSILFAWSIVVLCGCRRGSLILVCRIVLFAVRKGCTRMSFVV